jgi:hypothetical protein
MTLRRGDAKLLRRVLATNGGGVETHFTAGEQEVRLVPAAQVRRLIEAGLVRPKPNHSGFIIHTRGTAAALQEKA